MSTIILDETRKMLRLQQKSSRTEQAYQDWIYRFNIFHHKIAPSQFTEKEIDAFLHFLAEERKVSVATQKQAFQAILFLYRHVLDMPLPKKSFLQVYKKPPLPETLTRSEIKAVLNELKGEILLMASVLYGCGLRLDECLNLQVKDIDLEQSLLRVTHTNSNKNRELKLPDSLKNLFYEQLQKCRLLYEERMIAGSVGGVGLPESMQPDFPEAVSDWKSQFIFNSYKPSVHQGSGELRWNHRSASFLEKALKHAALKAGLTKRISCNVMRHSFATHLLENGYDIHIVQKLLGHSNIRSTMIYAHVLPSKTKIRSPLDELELMV